MANNTNHPHESSRPRGIHAIRYAVQAAAPGCFLLVDDRGCSIRWVNGTVLVATRGGADLTWRRALAALESGATMPTVPAEAFDVAEDIAQNVRDFDAGAIDHAEFTARQSVLWRSAESAGVAESVTFLCYGRVRTVL